MATKRKAAIPKAPAKRKAPKLRMGSSAHLYRYTSALALQSLARMLRRLPDLQGVNPEALIDTHHAERILEAIDRWVLTASSSDPLTLDEAFGVKVRGVRGGWKHPVLELGKAVRDNHYLLELARLDGLGFSTKEATYAIAKRWPARAAASSPRSALPWAAEYPTIPALAEASVASEVRSRSALYRPGRWIFAESGMQTTIADCKAEAAAWNAHDRRAYLANYPWLPARFRAE